MPEHPKYSQSRLRASCTTREQVYGICLRGKPGWGENMAFVTTMSTLGAAV